MSTTKKKHHTAKIEELSIPVTPKESRKDLGENSKRGDFNDSEEGEPELTLKDIITVSTMHFKSIEEQTESIMKLYNHNVTDGCFVFNALPGRALPRVPTNCFLLGHRNQITELCDPKGQRVALAIVDPLVTVKVIGTYQKNATFFGTFGKFVLNVPAGYFAKATSQNKPVLFSEGPHVILDSTFQFDQQSGFVSQNEPYISHSTFHILRVPAGKVAKAWLGTEPKILESRKEPYVFNDPQFRLVTNEKSSDKLSNYFYSSTDRYIEHGSIKRIIPHTGEVAITYNNGILDIVKPPKNGNPVIINSATHQFDGFISTALQTILFPSEEAKAQLLKDNPRATTDERNLKIFQTRDSLRVGVILVVAFRIQDPEMAITKLGKDGILPHIENIAFADMGKAIQLSTLQEVMYSSQNKPNSDSENNTLTIQDQVKKHLARDLEDCGIELARMNIETMKVLDEEIAKKLAGQSVTSAEFTTKQATLVKEYDIKTTEAKLRAETENISVQQKNQALIAEAQARLETARREAESLLIQADAKKKAEEMKGELYSKFPQLFDLELARIRTEALRSATIFITPQDMGNIFNTPFGLTLFNQQQQNAHKK